MAYSSPSRLPRLALKGPKPFYLLPVAAFVSKSGILGKNFPSILLLDYFHTTCVMSQLSLCVLRQLAQYYCTGSCCLRPLSSANAKQFSGVSKGSSLGFSRIYVYIIWQSWRTILLLAALPQLPNHHHPMIPERP